VPAKKIEITEPGVVDLGGLVGPRAVTPGDTVTYPDPDDATIDDIGPDGAGPFELALTARYEPVIVERLGGHTAQLYLIHGTPTWVYAPSEPPAAAVALYRLAQ
jgi:hypothetical protein